jgi:general secretion pathway protein L
VISEVTTQIQRAIDEVADAFAAARTLVAPRAEITLVQQTDGRFLQTEADSQSIADGFNAKRPFIALKIPENADIVLVCDASRFLARSLSLPAGARAFLDGIVRSQIDRLTPWKVDDAIFGWAVSEETSTGIVVCVVAAERVDFEASLSEFARYNIHSVSLRVSIPVQDGALSVPLDCQPFATRETGTPRRFVAYVAAMAVVIALVGQTGAFFVQSLLDQELITLRTESDALRQLIVSAKAGNNGEGNPVIASAQRKRAEYSASEILNELAKVLPDTTYLTVIDVENHTVHFEGVSRDVTALPELINASREILRNASFSAATVRQRGGEGDVFRIDAKILNRAEIVP